MNIDTHYRIAEYILKHSDEMQRELQKKKVSLECDPLLKSEFNNAVVSEVIFILASGLNLNYEEVSEVVTEDYLALMLGKEWFNL